MITSMIDRTYAVKSNVKETEPKIYPTLHCLIRTRIFTY